MPWKLLLMMSTLTPTLYCTAVTNSMPVMRNEPSPSTSMTVAPRPAASLAPMAAGSPKPMVPAPPLVTRLRGALQR